VNSPYNVSSIKIASNNHEVIWMRIILICLLLFTVHGTRFTMSNAFDVLNAPVGARPQSMGGAFTALADNADAPFWNPAGLGFIKFNEITTMQTKLSTDADHYYVSYVQPFGLGTLGISWIQLGLGQLFYTEALVDQFNEVVNINSFSYFSNAYLLAYGIQLNEKISAGTTIKYLNSNMTEIPGGQAGGYSVSSGLLIKPSEKMSVGLKIDEIINQLSWGTGQFEKCLPKLTFGLAIKPKFGTITADFDTALAVGYELKSENLAFRAGLADQNLSIGAGFKSGIAGIDYAYVKQNELSRDNTHRISFSGRW
jgi:hypothetical protein